MYVTTNEWLYCRGRAVRNLNEKTFSCVALNSSEDTVAVSPLSSVILPVKIFRLVNLHDHWVSVAIHATKFIGVICQPYFAFSTKKIAPVNDCGVAFNTRLMFDRCLRHVVTPAVYQY